MFLWTGFVDAAMVLEELDRRLPPGPIRFLDFGGGCGRVARHLAAVPGLKLSLADANGEHAAFAASSIPGLEAYRCGDAPPLDRPDASYDACLALSVFTHLPDGAYDAWLRELARVIRPGGVLLATLHGIDAVGRIAETAVLQEYFRLGAAEAREILAAVRRPGTFVYRRYDRDQLEAAGAGADYGSTFVSVDEAERRAAAAGFETLEYRPAGLRGWQDLAVLRRR
jgi:SAM-dependent methyltransferase